MMTREATCQILDMARDGLLDPVTALRSALNYMSEADVADLAHCEGWIVEDDDDDDDDEEEGESLHPKADADAKYEGSK